MKDQEWTYEKPSTWGDGIWMTEPDKVQWTDENTGFPCLAKRDKDFGFWCGYVGVSESHPFFKMPREDLEDLLIVHGEVSYADTCSGSICHVVEEGENDNVWWIGFDCFGYRDTNPYMLTLLANAKVPYEETYKTLEFVKRECSILAAQLFAYSCNVHQTPIHK